MLATAFVLLGAPVTWLEIVAFLLAVGCVALGIRELHWAWPVSIASSALYGWLFVETGVYGEAALQVLFAGLSAWGWGQWLRGMGGSTRASGEGGSGGKEDSRERGCPGGEERSVGEGRPGRAEVPPILVLGPVGRWAAVSGWVVGALLLGVLLGRWTDSDVPFLDAFPTAGSALGQWMLARKYLENWWVWIVVNAMSVGLFAWKGLWLTVVLYAVLGVMAVFGLRRWRAQRATGAGSAE